MFGKVDFLSLPQILASTGLFTLSWLAIDRRVTRNGPIPGARTLSRISNGLYSPASLLLLLLILDPSRDAQARYLYHLSKFYEYSDVLLVRAAGGAIDLHFAIHHLTTPYLTFFRVVRESEGWRWVAALNAFHHGVMYAYFAGWAAARPVLPWTGFLQLVVGIGGEGKIALRKTREGDSAGANLVGLALLCTYFVLFLRDLVLRRVEGTEGGEKNYEKKQT